MKGFVGVVKKVFAGARKIVTLEHIIRFFALIGLISVVVGICKLVIPRMTSGDDEAALVDVRTLKSQMLASSELTTAKLKLTCLSEFKDTGVVLLNRSDFMMVYDVTVRAGINLEEVDIPEEAVDYGNKIIYVTIPKAALQDEPAVDPASIKYFDTHFALFNVNEKEDANKAQQLARENAKEQALQSGILDMADKQSEAVVIGLLSKLVPEGYTIEVLKNTKS